MRRLLRFWTIDDDALWLLPLLLLVAASGCFTTPKRVAVPSADLTAVLLAGVAREERAADLLLEEAKDAAAAGDRERCVELADQAHLSQAKALHLATRLLYVAHLPYPGAEDQDVDPGPAPAPVDASVVCGHPLPPIQPAEAQ